VVPCYFRGSLIAQQSLLCIEPTSAPHVHGSAFRTGNRSMIIVTSQWLVGAVPALRGSGERARLARTTPQWCAPSRADGDSGGRVPLARNRLR
jgi:hypothetical protein